MHASVLLALTSAVLAARATGSSDKPSKCKSDLLSIYSGIPTPPTKLASDLIKDPQTDICHFTRPASLSKGYKSYSDEVVSWMSAHENDIISVLSECPSLSTAAASVGNVCSTDLTKTTGTAGSQASKTEVAHSSTHTSAAPRGMGMTYIALAAAGMAAVAL